MATIDADGWILLVRIAATVAGPLLMVLLGLYAAVRYGVKHGLKDAQREAPGVRAERGEQTAVQTLRLPDPRS